MRNRFAADALIVSGRMRTSVVLPAALGLVAPAFAASPTRYTLKVTLDPMTHGIDVAGTMERPSGKVETFHVTRAIEHPISKEGEGYVAMYQKLLGDYPYSKVALVENFWETEYGMPSFTLLGGSVLRLPFILTTSYPQEILHNWWGHGVFVAREGGNWSERLTAYLADHLVADQHGDGAAYRQEALQKYADDAARSKDFPLSAFRERHSPATEAVGYGKALMFFHMMRRDIGDDHFLKGLRTLYSGRKFQRASFDDVRSVDGYGEHRADSSRRSLGARRADRRHDGRTRGDLSDRRSRRPRFRAHSAPRFAP